MDLEQCNFLAENELLSVKPRFNLLRIEGICGDYGPFEAGIPTEVPLWIALLLRERQKCTITPPDWLNVEELKRISQDESDSAKFTNIAERFFELTHILITQCKEDLENLEQLRTLVKDIWDVRSAKLKTSVMQYLQEPPHPGSTHVQMDNITQFELAYIREFMLDATATIGKLSTLFLTIDDN